MIQHYCQDNNISEKITHEEVENIKFKLLYSLELNTKDFLMIKNLLKNDRDFISAPEFNFSVIEMIKNRGAISTKEIAKYMELKVADIYRLERNAEKKILKRLGLEKKKRKETKMGLKGNRKFTPATAMCFLITEKRKRNLNDVVDLKEFPPNIFWSNIRKCAELTDRINGDMVDLGNLPILRRGRPSTKEKKEDIKQENVEQNQASNNF